MLRPAIALSATALLLIVIATACGLRPESLKPLIDFRFPDVEWIDADELSERMNSSPKRAPLLLDVRSEEEFAVSHLRGAVRTEPGLRRFDSPSIPSDTPVVVYCSVGYRSAAIVDALRASGVMNVRNLRGGIFAWANEGRPVFRNGEPASTVHPYDRLWGFLLHKELRARPAGE